MKKLLLLLLCVPLMFSCGDKIKDINFSEIQDECECVDAILIIFNQAIEYHEEYGEDIESMPKNIQDEILLIFDKIDEFSSEVQSGKFELSKMMECPNFDEISIKSRKLEKIDKRYDS